MRDEKSSALSPPPSSLMKRVPAGTLQSTDVGRQITLAGWVQKQRDFGDLVFIDLRDRSGICQVVIDKSRGANDALLSAAKEARSEFVVRIDGEVMARAAASLNPNIANGEIEGLAGGMWILHTSGKTPLAVADYVDRATGLRL